MIPTPQQEQVWREEWMATKDSANSNEKRLLKWDSTMAGYMMGRRVAQAELESLRKDAERYRWLRVNAQGRIDTTSGRIWSKENELDAAIDAAMLNRADAQGDDDGN